LTTASGAITVLESYAPTAAAAAATTVPNFAPVTTGALNSVVINLSQTSLLFPFVTNQLGFDTGIAIANTTTDPFGTAPNSGTCNLNFYGSAAPTPSTNVAIPTGAVNTGTTGTPFLISAVAPGFQGYMIAQCNFVDAYGFGYIAYNLTQPSGAALGYLAVSLNRLPGNVGVSTAGN
jgi:hypothetical protein